MNDCNGQNNLSSPQHVRLIDVAASVSLRHIDLSKARSLAVDMPKLSGRRSSSTQPISTRFVSVYRFCVSNLWEDPKCRPEELEKLTGVSTTKVAKERQAPSTNIVSDRNG